MGLGISQTYSFSSMRKGRYHLFIISSLCSIPPLAEPRSNDNQSGTTSSPQTHPSSHSTCNPLHCYTTFRTPSSKAFSTMQASTHEKQNQSPHSSPTAKQGTMAPLNQNQPQPVQADGGWQAWLQVLGSFILFCMTRCARPASPPYFAFLTFTP